MFLKKKQEASGLPGWCQTDEDKEKYLQEYKDKEGIDLDRDAMATAMAYLQHDDFYLVLPSHARSEGVYDNRPQHFKVDLPKELFLEGDWEVGVIELLYTNTFYVSPRFTLTTDDRTWSVTNGTRVDGGTHFITITEVQYPDYYDVFEAMVARFEGVPVVEASRGPEQFDGCCTIGPECISRYP